MEELFKVKLLGGKDYRFNMFNTINCTWYLLNVSHGRIIILTDLCNSHDLLYVLNMENRSRMVK